MPYPKAFYALLTLTLSISAIFIYLNSKKLGEWFDPHVESAFLLTFAYFLFLRWLNPDIFGAEKFMDSAFISSALHSSSLPPIDPFLAGYKLNCYYYFGHVIGASITLMSFLSVQYGYNIAIAAIAAYSASTLYGFLKDLGMKRPWIGVIFTLFTGDLYGFYELLKDAFTLHRISGLYYWNATRVIPGTINEFPYFSFLHADFHAHVVAIPVFLLSISMLYSLIRSLVSGDSDSSKIILFIGLVVLSYVLYVTNSWDSPVFLFLFFVMLCILTLISFRKLQLRTLSVLWLTFLGCSISAFIAFTTVHSAAARIHFVKEHSPLLQFLLYFSIPLLFAYAWTVSSVRQDGSGSNSKSLALSLALSFVLSLALLLMGVEIAPVILPLMALSLYAIFRSEELSSLLMSALVLTACFFTLLPEFVAIDCRMNTVFKFYEVCWLMFCVPGSFALEFALSAINSSSDIRSDDASPSKRGRKAVSVLLILLFLTTLAYPAIATPQKCSVVRCTLDGMSFTKAFGEYDALLWAQKHVRGVIMSAAYNCYTYGGRFPAFTGNPVVVGWACHEVQWRGHGRMLAERMLDVKLFYTDPVKYWKVLRKYNVSYVVLGYEEKVEFKARRSEFLPLLGKILKVAYEDRNVVIYRVLT